MTTVFLDRFKTGPDGTFGGLTDDSNLIKDRSIFTVERPMTGDHPCISSGTYQVEPYASPKHGDVWQVMNVPGRSNIEIHPANLASELLGCIAVGDSLGKVNGVPAVLNSQKTFSMLKSLLPETFTLVITGIKDV